MDDYPKCPVCSSLMFKPTCSTCAARAAPAKLPEASGPSILSKGHPLRLAIRSIGVLVLFLPLLGSQAWSAYEAGDNTKAMT